MVPHGALDYSPPCLVNLNPRFFSAFPSFLFFPPTISKHILSRALIRYALLIRYNASVFVFRFARGNFDKAYIIRRRRRRRRKFSRIQYRARSPSRPVPDSFDLAEPRFSLVIFERVCRHVVSDSSTVFLSLLPSFPLSRKGGEEIREETVHGERLQNGCRQAEWAYVMEASRLAVYIVALRA